MSYLPPLTDGQGFFDCAPLNALATYMRDRVWLDVQTGDHFLPRVRIVQIIVKRTGDDIVLRQDWLEEGGGDVWLEKQRITVDAANIWRVAPTAFGLDEVQQWGVGEVQQGAMVQDFGHVERALVAEAVIEATTETFKIDRERLVSASTDRRDVHHRHQAIIVIYEMTDYRPADLCREVFGYKSQGGWNTARWKLDKPTNYGNSSWYQNRLAQRQGFVKAVRDIGRAADERLKPNRYRRPRDTFASDYTPVLP